MVRRGSASKCDIGWRRKPYSFSRRSAKILAISLCFDFSEGTLRTSSNLRIGKGRTALGESPLQVRMTALREQSPLRVRIQFPPHPSPRRIEISEEVHEIAACAPLREFKGHRRNADLGDSGAVRGDSLLFELGWWTLAFQTSTRRANATRV